MIRDMQQYSLLLLLKSGLKKEEKEKTLNSIIKLLGSVKNEKQNSIGEKKLTFPIKKELKAEYMLVDFEAEKVSSDFSKRVMMNQDVLRHLLIKN